jgi:hypothetical protein
VTKHDHSARTGETRAPLAKQLDLRVQTPHETGLDASFAHHILANPNYRDKTVEGCWTRHNIADLAVAFGVEPKPAPWKPLTFDRLWVIKLKANNAELQDLPQRLLKNDSKG